MTGDGVLRSVPAGTGELEMVVDGQWPGREWSATSLDGGMTNLNWKVSVCDGDGPAPRDYAVQLLLPDEAAAHIGINRNVHERVMTLIDELRLGPRLVAWRRTAPKAIISEYVEFQAPETSVDYIRAATHTAEALSVLHSKTQGAPLPGWISDPFSGAEWLYAKVERIAPELASGFRWAMEVNSRCQKARGPYESSLLHSDLSMGNILLNSTEVSLIDWEYAGLGDKYFDCADFVEKWDLDAEQEQAFLERYREDEPLEFLASVIHMYRFSSRLREGLWAASISVVNFVDFDHTNYARTCLDRLVAIVDDPRFGDSVRAVDAARKG